MNLVRFLKGCLAIGIVIGIVIASPWILLTCGRVDALYLIFHPDMWTLAHPRDITITLISLIAWISWALASLSLIAEGLSAITHHRISLHFPGISLFAPASAVLITAIAGLVTITSIHPASAHADTPIEDSEDSSVISSTPSPDIPTDENDVQERFITHIVNAGDDLWSLAERYLNDGSQWRTIVALNKSVLLDSTDLDEGMALTIPVYETDKGDDSDMPSSSMGEQMVSVNSGDTLSALAEIHLGDANAWPLLVEANADLIDDPNMIEVGWQLTIPTSPTYNEPIGIDDIQSGHPTSNIDTNRSDPEDISPHSQADLSGDKTLVTPESLPSKALVIPADLPYHEDPSQSVQLNQDGDHPLPIPSESVQEIDHSTEHSNGINPDSEGEVTSSALEIFTRPLTISSLLTAESDIDISAVMMTLGSLGIGLSALLGRNFIRRRRQQISGRPLGYRLPSLDRESSILSNALNYAASTSMDESDIHLSSDKAHPMRGLSPAQGESPWSVPIGYDERQEYCLPLDGSMICLEGQRSEVIDVLSAIALHLAHNDRVDLIVCLEELEWLNDVDSPSVTSCSHSDLENRVEALGVERLAAHPSGISYEELRDSQGAEAWRPIVVITDRWEAAYLPPVQTGISILSCTPHPLGQSIYIADGYATLPNGDMCTLYAAEQPARRCLEQILTTASSTDYPPADWWDRGSYPPDGVDKLDAAHSQEVDMSSSDYPHPFLTLFGRTDIVGGRGERPQRAVKQCVEYCAWILSHPGATSTDMTRDLLVAETTRRSNMSRLRSWLGTDDQGSLYLPEAYTGKITAHPAVTSDWEKMSMLVSPGINRTSTSTLISALELVQGAPLADAAPGQWLWAEQMRRDMEALVVDIAHVIVERSCEKGDLDIARWALDKAYLVNPESELLAVADIRLSHANGERSRCERLVMELIRRSRDLGIDLQAETVVCIQQVMEGRARAVQSRSEHPISVGMPR